MKTDVIDVKPLNTPCLEVTFADGKKGVLDLSPYLDFGVMKELKNRDYFNQVTILFGALSWPNGQDIAPQMAYDETEFYADHVTQTALTKALEQPKSI